MSELNNRKAIEDLYEIARLFRWLLLIVWLTAVVGLFTGCSSPPEDPPDLTADCLSLRNTLCTTVTSCVPEVTPQDCIGLFAQYVDCGDPALSERASAADLRRCEADVEVMTCLALFDDQGELSLPLSCQGANDGM